MRLEYSVRLPSVFEIAPSASPRMESPIDFWQRTRTAPARLEPSSHHLSHTHFMSNVSMTEIDRVKRRAIVENNLLIAGAA